MVGNVVTAQSLNNQAGVLAVALRDICQACANYQQQVVKLGLAGLETAGLSPADAQALLTGASYMNTIAQVYLGTVGQTPAFNFQDATASLTGDQAGYP
jgi:hypothetical protein